LNNRALILLSGGLDSATTAAIAIRDGNECSALTFAYGQKHSVEISFARRLAEYFKIRNHLVVTIPQELFTASSLSRGSGKKIPKGRDVGALEGIPSTYVPARNILFLSYALACAENSAISEIYIGVNSLDYSGYPDCRPEFIEAFEAMANIGTKSAAEGRLFHIRAPLMRLKKW
jgi:7-cyano-7-deazaguanine synthase